MTDYQTDYDLPHGWAGMSADERDRWFKAERARRRSMAQHTAFAEHVRRARRRRDRRVAARNETVDLADYR